ncbi:MAG: acyltransferase [Myxococcaceae bacterium]
MSLFLQIRERVQRDGALGFGQLVRKGSRYLWEIATAPFHLRGVTSRGSGVRTLGRPRIDNLGELHIGEGTLLRSVNVPVELATGPGASLRIGRNVRINYGVSIGAMGSITLGDRVRIGPYAMIIDTEFHDVYDRNKMPPPRPVVLEDDVWIGAKATILPGVTIGRGAIVGISSVVGADVAPFTVVMGIPARVVRKLEPEKFVST